MSTKLPAELPQDWQDEIKQQANSAMRPVLRSMMSRGDAYIKAVDLVNPYALRAYKAEQENERLRKALEAKLEKVDHRDFAYLGPEAEAAIYAVYEGADLWEQEYKDCRHLLQELVDLKVLKEANGKTADYLARQPKAWESAIKFLESYQHQTGE